MNPERIKEIIESHGVVGVTYRDAPVWIEQLTDDNTAWVTVLDTNQRMEVPVERLVEDNPGN